MEELERYECFAVPTHAALPPADLATTAMRSRAIARPAAPDLEFLGIEAIPSPALAEFSLNA